MLSKLFQEYIANAIADSSEQIGSYSWATVSKYSEITWFLKDADLLLGLGIFLVLFWFVCLFLRFSEVLGHQCFLLFSTRRRAGSLPFQAEVQMKADNSVSTVA